MPIGFGSGTEISKLNRFSPKRNSTLDRIRVENPTDNKGLNVGIRAFCPTRWTVCGEAIQSIIDNYSILNQLWDKTLEAKLEQRAELTPHPNYAHSTTAQHF